MLTFQHDLASEESQGDKKSTQKHRARSLRTNPYHMAILTNTEVAWECLPRLITVRYSLRLAALGLDSLAEYCFLKSERFADINRYLPPHNLLLNVTQWHFSKWLNASRPTVQQTRGTNAFIQVCKAIDGFSFITERWINASPKARRWFCAVFLLAYVFSVCLITSHYCYETVETIWVRTKLGKRTKLFVFGFVSAHP